MKTLKQTLKYDFKCLDCRDRRRIAKFCSKKEMLSIGIEYTGNDKWKPIPFTEENVDEQFKKDIVFAWEKYVNDRGISTQFMLEVLKMWCWILEIDISVCDTTEELIQFLGEIYHLEKELGEIKKCQENTTAIM